MAWFTAAFAVQERVQVGDDHRSQMAVGDGAVILGDVREDRIPPRVGKSTSSVIVRVEDARGHCERARAHGARILDEPRDLMFGERQYSAEALAGHQWTFSQTLEDVAPESWGGLSVAPAAAHEP